jgi:uncharacterized protein (TIRG00374 family)
MKTILRWLLRLIGPVLLAFFLWRSDLGAIGRSLATLDPWPFLLSAALAAPFILVKSWRWRLLMRELELIPPSLWYLCALYLIGLYAGGITPGQSGDFVKGWYLRGRGLPLGPALVSVALDRLFDFVIMAPLAILGLVVFIDVFPPQTQELARIATFGFAGLVLLLTPAFMARRPREWAFGTFRHLLPGRLRTIADRLRDQLAALDLRPRPLALALAASAISAVFTMVRIWLCYAALGLYNIPLVEMVGSTALIAILQALPISFAGVGVRDLVLIALLTRHGASPEQAIILSALFLVLNIEHILIGFLVSLRYPIERPPQDVER